MKPLKIFLNFLLVYGTFSMCTYYSILSMFRPCQMENAVLLLALEKLWQIKFLWFSHCRNNSRSLKDSCFVDSDKTITIQEQEGKLKNILKKTYLKRWMVPDHKHQDGSPRNIEESDPAKTKHSNINFARLVFFFSPFRCQATNILNIHIIMFV